MSSRQPLGVMVSERYQVPEEVKNHDKMRVTVSIITFLLVIWMLYSEFNYFVFPGYKFRFVPDADFTAKLKLNVDMTVAMPCDCESLVDIH